MTQYKHRDVTGLSKQRSHLAMTGLSKKYFCSWQDAARSDASPVSRVRSLAAETVSLTGISEAPHVVVTGRAMTEEQKDRLRERRSFSTS